MSLQEQPLQPLLLITKSDFEPYVSLSGNLDPVKKLNMHITHAQDFDLRPLLGDLLFYDIMKKVGELQAENGGRILQESGAPIHIIQFPNADYSHLINGGTYLYKDVPISFHGLKPVLVHYATARVLSNINGAITPTGFKAKLNEYSEFVDNREVVRQITQYQSLALGYWNQVKDFLNIHYSHYPLWHHDGCKDRNTGRKSGARIYSLN